MNVASLLEYKTPAVVSIDAPMESTVRVPLHRGRIVWHLLCALAVILYSAYVLIDDALDYERPRNSNMISIVEKNMRDIPADSQQIVASTLTVADMLRKYGREWRMFVAAVGVLGAMFAFFRELARLQSPEPGMIVAPAGLTISCDASHRVIQRIPWTAVVAIEDKNYKGSPSVAIRLRDGERYLVPGRFFNKLGPNGEMRVVVSPRSLQINWQDLKKLLIRYFEAHGPAAAPK